MAIRALRATRGAAFARWPRAMAELGDPPGERRACRLCAGNCERERPRWNRLRACESILGPGPRAAGGRGDDWRACGALRRAHAERGAQGRERALAAVARAAWLFSRFG